MTQRSKMNYYDAFILVAPDCPALVATPPPSKPEGKSIPRLEYEMLFDRPYQFTQEEVLFRVHVQRLGLADAELALRRDALWNEFYSKSRACLRASMLPKKYGWGLHFDSVGRAALVAVESPEYEAFRSGARPAARFVAMRNKKA